MAFDFYFAGGQCQETTDLICKLNGNVLKSYVNDTKEIPKWFEYKKQGWQGKLLIDNGAFTVHRKGGSINIDEYIEWLNTNNDTIDYAIALDHIPGVWGTKRTYEELRDAPIKTWENYLYMVDKCTNPEKLLPVFHQGEDFKYLTQIVNFKIKGNYVPYICISGNKELTNTQREGWYLECFNVIKKSNNPNVKVHCLGSATLSNAVKFPMTSMDATSWIMTGATGGIFTDYGAVQVSKESIADKDNIAHFPKEVQENINKYCNKHGITLEQVQDNYKYRMMINVNYLYEKSKSTSYIGKMPKINKLF